MPVADDYHFHVYFEADSKPVAQAVVANFAKTFEVDIGHFHDRPVGPHPTGSCQVTVAMGNFGRVMDWLVKNRQGLTVFIHANTGDVIRDHTEHAIWMGEMMRLDLDFLHRFAQAQQRQQGD